METNPLQYFKPFDRKGDGRRAKRDAFTREEIAAIRAVAKGRERVFFDFLVSTGIRPGELYTLDWSCVDLEAGTVRIEPNWDHRGRKFVEPKTKAGARVVPLSSWLVAELSAHKARGTGEGLVFSSSTGRPMNPSNVRRDIWVKLKKRVGVRELDLYSLRHTFASLGRTAGERAFNVARMMGHSRSSLVDQVYAHSMQSGMASVAERVTARALGEQPKLRVIEGGARDVRQPLDEASQKAEKDVASA